MKIDKVYTKKGDDGSTTISSKSKIDKNNILIEMLGSLDELNSFMGLAKVSIVNNKKFLKIYNSLLNTQKKIFDIGAEVSLITSKNKKVIIISDDVKKIENEIDNLNVKLDALNSFILPGTGKENAYLHISRSICRKAERNLVNLSHVYKVNFYSIQFLNRLSDLLFVYCRIITLKLNEDEKTWRK